MGLPRHRCPRIPVFWRPRPSLSTDSGWARVPSGFSRTSVPFENLRDPSRMAILPRLALAVFAAQAAASLFQARRNITRILGCTMLAALLLLEQWSPRYGRGDRIPVNNIPDVYTWLSARQHRSAVAELPVLPFRFVRFNTMEAYFSTFHEGAILLAKDAPEPGIFGHQAFLNREDFGEERKGNRLVAERHGGSLGEVNLLWTAPGDNGPFGQATSYDLRWSEMPITAGTWDSPDVHPFALPAPLAGGSDEMATVTGLPDEIMIYFAMTTSDEVPNESLLSNIADALTAGVAPEPIDDFAVTGFTGTTADFLWTARADVGPLGKPSTYDMRYSTAPITPANFDLALPVFPAPPTPVDPGMPQMHTVTGLDDSTTYYFAIKAVDAAMNVSPMHTNGDVMIVTPDVTAPGQVLDLTATAGMPTLSLVPAPAIDASGEASATKSKEMATDGTESTYFGTPVRPPQDEYITVDTLAVRAIAQLRLRSPDQTAFFPEDVEIQVSNSPMSGFVTVATFTGLPATKFDVAHARYPGQPRSLCEGVGYQGTHEQCREHQSPYLRDRSMGYIPGRFVDVELYLSG